MKNIVLAIFALALFSCSNENCSEEKQSINNYFDKQVQIVRDNPGPTGPDFRKIESLELERDRKLEQACN